MLFISWLIYIKTEIPFQLVEVKLYTLFFFINHTSACTRTGPRWFLSSYWPLYCLIILSGFCIYSYMYVDLTFLLPIENGQKKRKKGIKHEWEHFVLVPSFFLFFFFYNFTIYLIVYVYFYTLRSFYYVYR